MSEISKEISCQREQNSTKFEVMPSATDIARSESILNETHYGLEIYSHILRLYYPDEVVLRLTKRDCGLCRNPFNSDKKTLHIWIEKTNPKDVKSLEFARHEDSTNAIPTGDAFDFAELYYKQQGTELLQTLNKELNLRIGEERNFYKNNLQNQNQGNQINPINHGSDNLFSFFRAPISNTIPLKAISLFDAYNYIAGDYAKQRTEKLRTMLSPLSCGEGTEDRSQARKFKSSNFDYCTFSGVFTIRNDKALIKHSGLLCLDFDHVNNVQTLFNQLLKDEYFETQLLFRSPSGDGLKWIISIGTIATTHGEYFLAVSNYIKATYNVEVDKSGKDISRACFLPHDPQAFINPKFV